MGLSWQSLMLGTDCATYRNTIATVYWHLCFDYVQAGVKDLSLRTGQRPLLQEFLAFHFVTWILSLDYTSVASSTVLVTLQPVFVVLALYLSQRGGIKGPLAATGYRGSVIIGLSDFELAAY